MTRAVNKATEYVTVGRARVWFGVTVTLLFLVFGARDISKDVSRTQDLRASCEAGDKRAMSELRQRTHLIVVNRGRKQAGEPGSPERLANAVALRHYIQDRVDLMASVDPDLLENPDTVGKERIDRDCAKVYPATFPTNLFL